MGGRVTLERVIQHCALCFSKRAPGESYRRVSRAEEVRRRGEGRVDLGLRLEGSRALEGLPDRVVGGLGVRAGVEVFGLLRLFLPAFRPWFGNWFRGEELKLIILKIWITISYIMISFKRI